MTKMDEIRSFVPCAFGAALGLGDPKAGALARRHHAVMLFADISGFSSLADQLASQGAQGAEQLMRLLNGYFGQMVEQVKVTGGEVLKFAGDALIASWVAENPDYARSLEEASLLAASCAASLREFLHDQEVSLGIRLGLKLALGAGEAFAVRVGGMRDRWELLSAGAALTQLAEIMPRIQSGQIGCSSAFYKLNANQLKMEKGSDDFFLLEEPPASLPTAQPLTTLALTEDLLRQYTPYAVLYRLDAGMADWLAELRSVTVGFFHFVGLDDQKAGFVERLHEAVRVVQNELYNLGGSLDKVLVDEKGTSVIVAFGLPPTATDRRELRALAAAESIHRQLKALELPCDIGIASGRVFCGPVGNASRREYTMMGQAVNLAARLMQLAQDEILCDEATLRSVQEYVEGETLSPTRLKGFRDLVAPFRLRGLRMKRNWQGHDESSLVGRKEELAAIRERLRDIQEGKRSWLVIEGEAGIGKSRLAFELLSIAQSMMIAYVEGAGQAIRQSTPWHAWQPVFHHLLGIQEGWAASDREAHIEKTFQKREHLQPWLALLNPVLQVELEESEESSLLEGPARADKTRWLLCQILQDAVRTAPLLLLLDDAHWFDSASWRLLGEVLKQVDGVMLVLLTRPMSKPPEEWATYLEEHRPTLFSLGGLSPELLKEFVAQKIPERSDLGVISTWIYEKSQGNPFVSQELVYTLRESKLLESHKSLSPRELQSLPLSGSIEGLVNSRIDRLEASTQLALKTASVIGPVFSAAALEEIFPLEEERPRLSAILETLVQAGMILPEGRAASLAYVFRHRITQEAAYGTLLREQREMLHLRVARWLEAENRGRVALVASLLAFHYSETDDVAKALDYMEMAAEQAIREGVFLEAEGFLQKMIQRFREMLGGRAMNTEETLRFARWHRQLSDTMYAQGEASKSIEAGRQALQLLQFPIQEKPLSQVRTLLRHFGGLVGSVFWPKMFKPRDEERPRWIEATLAAHRVAIASYVVQNPLLNLTANILSGHLAILSAPFSQACKGIVSTGLVMGFFGFKRPAHYFLNRGESVARASNDVEGLLFFHYGRAIYLLGTSADWETFSRDVRKGLSLSVQLNNVQEREICWVVSSGGALFQGELIDCVQKTQLLLASAGRRNNAQHLCWGNYVQATALDWLGHRSLALEALDRSWEALEQTQEEYSKGFILTMRAGLYSRDEARLEEAKALLEEGSKIILKMAAPIWSSLLCFHYGLEAIFSLWKHAQAKKEPTQAWEQLCQKFLKAQRKFMRMLPNNEPSLWWNQAQAELLMGQRGRAEASLRKALAASRSMGQRYLEAHSLWSLGSLVEQEDKVASLRFFEEAEELFLHLGSASLLRRLKEAHGQEIAEGLEEHDPSHLFASPEDGAKAAFAFEDTEQFGWGPQASTEIGSV
ncbi:MAG: AAA family ATPase [Myxococcales bacterium]|nr:AAA family ATPase [Myxococcales bacterium]